MRKPLTLEKLMWMRDGIAKLVLEEPVYIPILERLERMVDEAKGKNDALSRARQYVEERRAMEAVRKASIEKRC